MSLLSSIIDTFTNVRQKDYNEAKHMHAQLVGAHARASGPAVNIPALAREVLGAATRSARRFRGGASVAREHGVSSRIVGMGTSHGEWGHP